MKFINVEMNKSEKVLASYLLRVFSGELIEKKSCKVVCFPEENFIAKMSPDGWTKQRFVSFCDSLATHKTTRVYKTRLIEKGAN